MSKKILLVVTKGDIGGAQISVLNLARGLKDKGYNVTVGFGEGEFLKSRLGEIGIQAINFKYLKRTNNPLASIFFAFELKAFLKQDRYDVVQFNSSNSLPGAVGAKLADKKIKTVFTVHGLSVLDKHYNARPWLKLAYRLFFKFFFLFVDAPVFVSHHDLTESKALGLVKDGTIIYNGLDVSTLHFMPRDEARSAIAKKMGRDLSANFIIGSIGRLSYQKNYDFLIRSFPEILKAKPNAIAIIIGDGPLREQCEALIKSLGIEKQFLLLGEMGNAAECLKAFDLFILPSRYEGLPITLTECLFAGAPVLASDVGGNGEIANKQSLYALNDTIDFLKKFSGALSDLSGYVPDKSKSGQFEIEKMSADYFRLFEGSTSS